MKDKLDGKKMSAEELAKTQVLNLSDVERIASYEKMVSKKPAIVIGIIGLFALSLGIFYPKIVSFMNNEEDKGEVYNRVEKEEDKEILTNDVTTQLTCTKSSLGNADGVDYSLTYNYTFKNDALQNYTKLAIYNANATIPTSASSIEGLYNGFVSFSTTPVTGYFLQASKTTNGFTVSLNVDLTKFNISTLPDINKTHFVSNVEFSLNEKKDIVSNISISNGFTCR